MRNAFDPDEERRRLEKRRSMMKRRRYVRSRLDKYRAEIAALRSSGASLRAIQMWLRERRVRIAHTTISRYLERLEK